jgi:hypothetical protein
MSATSQGDGRADQATRPDPETSSRVPPGDEPAATGGKSALEAARVLATAGPQLGWGLLALGFLLGLGRALESTNAGLLAAGWSIAAIHFASLILGFGLAGWSLAVLCKVCAGMVVEQVERSRGETRALIAELARVATALEREVEQPRRPFVPTESVDPAAIDRARRLADIERATRAESWDEAESLIADFEEMYPGDTALAGIQESLGAGRRRSLDGKLAELDAARQVNDPGRVIELYLGVVASLEVDHRGSLERDLAKWFLGLIHRRLRTGKIEPDVVALATQVADTFAATVEGASMRAALPTLRRSVGLCPRCAQPYTGTGDACPACLGGALGLTAMPPRTAPEAPS